MAIIVKHPFVSAIPDAADTSLVRPTNWNAAIGKLARWGCTPGKSTGWRNGQAGRKHAARPGEQSGLEYLG